MAGETTTKPTAAVGGSAAATTSSTTTSGSAAAANLPNGPAKPVAEVKKDALDTAMDNYDKVYKRFGDPEKAKAFLEAVGKDKSPLVEEKESRSAASAARAREMSKEQNHDMTFADRSGRELGLPERPPGYGAAYMSHDWEIASIDGADNPAELLPDTWKIIVSGNRLLHGYVLQPNGLLARARFPAFTLKASTDGVPHFEVFDDSSIQIKETSGTREKSMAANGFSSSAIQASVSGGFGGWGASASAARATESQRSSSSGDFQDHKEYTACYSFPRALVYIDEQNVDVSPECKKELSGLSEAARALDQDKMNADLIRNATKLRERFFTRFGHVFVTKFLLGGQLTASKTADSFGNTSDASIRDSMKLSAAISVDSKFVSASASGSKENSSASQAHNSMVASASSLAWSARGGNTLLAASPSEWANSVGGFRTWRPLEQDQVSDLVDLIMRVTDEKDQLIWSSIWHTFKIIDDNHYIPQTVSAPTGPVKWDKRFRLEAPDGRMVKWNGTIMCLSDNADASDSTVFRAVDADDKVRSTKAKPDMEEFRADWPLFLPTADWAQRYSRENAFRDQIPGLWVNGDGQMRREVSFIGEREVPIPDDTRKICRWSFRLASDPVDFNRPWDPNNRRVIADGAQVKMYCHSYFSGSYRTTDKPPYFAAAVYGKENSNELKVMRFGSDQLRWLKFPGTQSQWFDPQRIPFLQNDSGTVQGYMEQFDRGEGNEPKDVTAKLEDFRNIMAFNNSAVAKPFVDASMARSSLEQNMWTAGKVTDDSAFALYKTAVPPGIQEMMDKWKSETKFTKEMTFTVRYFR